MSKKNLSELECHEVNGKEFSKLDKEQALDLLDEINGPWSINDVLNILESSFSFRDFSAAINFVNEIADLAEQENHHPAIRINYNKVSLELTTHDVSGLSKKDFILAAKISKILF